MDDLPDDQKSKEPDANSGDRGKELTVAFVIGRGTTYAIIGFTVGYDLANTTLGN